MTEFTLDTWNHGRWSTGWKEQKRTAQNCRRFQWEIGKVRPWLFLPSLVQLWSYKSLRQETRAALLASKQAIDAQSKSNKEDLLAFASVLQEKQDSSEKTTYACTTHRHQLLITLQWRRPYGNQLPCDRGPSTHGVSNASRTRAFSPNHSNARFLHRYSPLHISPTWCS